MITLVLSLYDKKAQAFKNPFFAVRAEVATRSLAAAVNNPAKDNDLSNYPSDFALYQLGTFNDENAHFDLHAQPVLIAEALQFKEPSANLSLPFEHPIHDAKERN